MTVQGQKVGGGPISGNPAPPKIVEILLLFISLWNYSPYKTDNSVLPRDFTFWDSSYFACECVSSIHSCLLRWALNLFMEYGSTLMGPSSTLLQLALEVLFCTKPRTHTWCPNPGMLETWGHVWPSSPSLFFLQHHRLTMVHVVYTL